MNQEMTYLTLLKDSLRKKNVILENLLALTMRQEELIKEDNVEEDHFDSIISEKENLITQLSQLDDGFEQIYERVRDVIRSNPNQYQVEIQELQSLIQMITDRSVNLQTIEKRNRTKFENLMLKKRSEIKNVRVSSQAVSNYYKSMANQKSDSSFFLDKKN